MSATIPIRGKSSIRALRSQLLHNHDHIPYTAFNDIALQDPTNSSNYDIDLTLIECFPSFKSPDKLEQLVGFSGPGGPDLYLFILRDDESFAVQGTKMKYRISPLSCSPYRFAPGVSCDTR
jgi:hypothetical protein